MLFLLKNINNQSERKWYQSCSSFPHDLSPRCGSFTVIERRTHSAHQPACKNMNWAPTLQLYFCPICWTEWEAVRITALNNSTIRGVCPLLLTRLVQHVSKAHFSQSCWCVAATAPELCDVCTSWQHPSLLTPVETLVISLLVTPSSQDMLVQTPVTKWDVTSQYSAHFSWGFIMQGHELWKSVLWEGC